MGQIMSPSAPNQAVVSNYLSSYCFLHHLAVQTEVKNRTNKNQEMLDSRTSLMEQ